MVVALVAVFAVTFVDWVALALLAVGFLRAVAALALAVVFFAALLRVAVAFAADFPALDVVDFTAFLPVRFAEELALLAADFLAVALLFLDDGDFDFWVPALALPEAAARGFAVDFFASVFLEPDVFLAAGAADFGLMLAFVIKKRTDRIIEAYLRRVGMPPTPFPTGQGNCLDS